MKSFSAGREGAELAAAAEEPLSKAARAPEKDKGGDESGVNGSGEMCNRRRNREKERKEKKTAGAEEQRV